MDVIFWVACGILDYLSDEKPLQFKRSLSTCLRRFFLMLFKYLREIWVSQKFAFEPANIIVMNETVVWVDMVAETAMKKNRGKRLPLKVVVTRECI